MISEGVAFFRGLISVFLDGGEQTAGFCCLVDLGGRGFLFPFLVASETDGRWKVGRMRVRWARRNS